MFKGVGASAGIALGKAFVIKEEKMIFEITTKLSVQDEIERFNNAMAVFIADTGKIIDDITKNIGVAEAAILEGHVIMVQDPEIISGVTNLIQDVSFTSENAVETAFSTFQELFASLGDEMMSQRASDLGDIKKRLIKILTGDTSTSITDIKENCILVSHDLTPSDTGRMDKSKVLGIISEVGGKTSHTAIISRTLEIPAVLGVNHFMETVNNGDFIIIDGASGDIFVNPSQDLIEKYTALKEEFLNSKKQLHVYLGKPTITKDNQHVELCANIGGVGDLDAVLGATSEGVGLFRTEFLFMDRDTLPTEDEQFEVYQKVAESLAGKPVIIRTLDIGGDKDLPYLGLTKEDNPFLGYRAIRMCLDQSDLFKIQLRALLRASNFGNIKIMLPLITSVDELRQARVILEEIKQELKQNNIPFNENIPLGIMVETAAASLIADILAKEAAFFSIGTNDLTQYTMAVDRGNSRVSYLYSTYNPAVMRSIAHIIKCAKKENIMVGMCGEAASDPLMVPFLLACGLDEFSVSASATLSTRKLISTLDKKELEGKLDHILQLATEKEVESYLKTLI